MKHLMAALSLTLSRWLRTLLVCWTCSGVWTGVVRAEAVLAPAPGLAASSPATQCPPQAQALSAEQVQAGMRSARDHGLLWRVSQGGRVSWLYGTVHVARLEWMFPGPRVLAALRSADRVALELDLLDPHIAQRLQRSIQQPAGAAPLPPTLATRLAQAEAQACMADTLVGLRPQIRAITLSLLDGRADGLDPAYGIDGFLAGLARGLGLPVVSLETPEQQIALLTGADGADPLAQITQALDGLENGQSRQQMRRLTQAWADSRLDELSDYPSWCQCMDTPEDHAMQRRLLDERNHTMAQQLMRLHRSGQRVFLAVGALHMIGPQGLPTLLRTQGFQVEQVLPATRRAPPPEASSSSVAF